MPRSAALLLTAAALLATACQQAAPSAAGAPPAAVVAQADAAAVVADSHLAGGKRAMITVGTPADAGFGLLAVQHRWVVEDIFQYTASLKVWDGSAYVDFETPLRVEIPRKGEDAKTSAVFTSLKQGSKYRVQLVAEGNAGGTAADTALNADTDTTAVFDFTATQDVQDTLSATLTVTLDQVAFSGTGTGTVATPADGTFENPTSPEAGTAE